MTSVATYAHCVTLRTVAWQNTANKIQQHERLQQSSYSEQSQQATVRGREM